MHRRRLGVAAAGLLVACTLHPSHVSAATVGIIGEVYVSKAKNVRPGEQASITVFCPKGREVLSGGTTGGGTDISVSVASNGPVDGPDSDRKPDDAWKGTLNNGSTLGKSMAVRAQCAAKTDSKYIKHLNRTGGIPAGASSDTRIDCPDDLFATGGGVVVTGGTMKAPLASTMPFDNSSDADTDRDNVWVTHYLNQSSKKVHESYTTICADPDALGVNGVGQPVVPQVANGAGAAMSVGFGAVGCPMGSVALGGGVGESSEIIGSDNIASLWADIGSRSATGWRGYVNNLTSGAETFKVAAVCVDPYVDWS